MNHLEHLHLIMRVFAQDVVQGFTLLIRNGFALLGLSLLCVIITLNLRADLRALAEVRLRDWLEERQLENDVMMTDVDAADRATAIDPQDLSREQAKVATWLSNKYKVAPEPISALVAETYVSAPQYQLDPTLVLAVMAIESNFNPFAQSPVGAQGLMQVMTKVHLAKYKDHGGELAAFDPITNLHVGSQVLRDCIKSNGSTELGLRCYVGASVPDADGGYVRKVLTEQKRLQQVAQGFKVPLLSPSTLQMMTDKVESWLPSPFGRNKTDAPEDNGSK